jgi:glycosyltransferase involved in cell wall biosynthesis
LQDAAAQHEDTVQLLVFASSYLQQSLAQGVPLSVTIISIEPDTSGWARLTTLFSNAALKHIAVEALAEPAVPNLAIGSHKPAYNLFEYFKSRHFDEIHALDRYGPLYYPTQAKLLGLSFLRTAFAVHVVGGSLYRAEAEDRLLDNLTSLMDDLLERGSVERADAVFVHDRKAWQWYSTRIARRAEQYTHDLSWPDSQSVPSTVPANAEAPLALIYYGPLGPDGGLPLFCDIVARALPKLARPVEVVFVGQSQPVGGMDATSYIRVRSAKWKAAVTIKRSFSLEDELALICQLDGIVITNTARRESLRARLAAALELSVLHVGWLPGPHEPADQAGLPAVPNLVVEQLLAAAQYSALPPAHEPPLVARWAKGRNVPAQVASLGAAPLELPTQVQPRVSVIVTHFSRPQKLRTALESLRQQTYHNYEVIVVDDGSPDPRVQEALSAIAAEIAPLGWRLLRQENRYLGAARNFGARHAQGDYLLFMDDDNAAKPHEISTFVAVAQRSEADIVTTFYDGFEDEHDLETGCPSVRFTPFGADATLGILTNCFGDANALYRRQAFERLGGFTEDYGITHEDWEFFCRATLEGLKIVTVPEPLFWYRVDPHGMFRNEHTLLHKNANLRRHIRPFLQKLPHDQARLVQLAQGLNTQLPLITVGEQTRAATPRLLQDWQAELPYARVAIITRTKDRPLLLRRAIQSALDQTFRDWLLVIVNDGGKPETVEMLVEDFGEELVGRVLVLHNPIALGMQTAANIGLTSCDSDFIVVHDDDDSWEPSFLARTVSHLDAHGWNARLGGVITWAQVIIEELGDDGEIKTHDRFVFNPLLHHLSLVDLAVENRFPPISFLFRRAALDVVGPFREQHGPLGDWDFHLRMLRQFDIDVITEPLANYHHRTKGTSGDYGNSVHAQTDTHRRKRTELINNAVRGEEGQHEGMPLAHLIALGELQHSLLATQRQEFQRLNDYLWTVEQRVKFIADEVEKSARGKKAASAATPHNFVLNGDFRLWPGIGKTSYGPNSQYAFTDLCPGFVICHDGRGAAYRAEQHIWRDGGQCLPFGTTYLHLENDGQTQGGSFFVVEIQFPALLELSGKRVCISGCSRMRSTQMWMYVGGRYRLRSGTEVSWPYQAVGLSSAMHRWSVLIDAPSVQAELAAHGDTRIVLMLPHDQKFEFELSQVQVELGELPSNFVYNGRLSLRQRLALLRQWLRPRPARVVAPPTAVSEALSAELSA